MSEPYMAKIRSDQIFSTFCQLWLMRWYCVEKRPTPERRDPPRDKVQTPNTYNSLRTCKSMHENGQKRDAAVGTNLGKDNGQFHGRLLPDTSATSLRSEYNNNNNGKCLRMIFRLTG